MADQRDGGIAWCDETWNPIRGCSRVSPGCENCYAETVAARFCDPGMPYHGLATRKRLVVVDGVEVVRHGARWTGKVRVISEHLADPLRWKRPRLVFTNSMSDMFHESLGDNDIAAMFGIMAACPDHIFQILTKRSARMRKWFETWESGGVASSPVRAALAAQAWLKDYAPKLAARVNGCIAGEIAPWPLPNVHLGVSAENQAMADTRVPDLMRCSAAVRWVSYEPGLGPVDFKPWLLGSKTIHLGLDIEGALRNKSFDGFTKDGKSLSRREAEDGLFEMHGRGIKMMPMGDCDSFSDQTGCPGHPKPRIDWIVIGGESGDQARPFDIQWARDVISQCRASGVAAFMKQAGAEARWNGMTNGPIGEQAWPQGTSIADNMDGSFRVHLKHDKGGDMAELPPDLRVRMTPGEKWQSLET